MAEASNDVDDGACYATDELCWDVSFPVLTCIPLNKPLPGQQHLVSHSRTGNADFGGVPCGLLERYRHGRPWSAAMKAASDTRDSIAEWFYTLPARRIGRSKDRKVSYGQGIYRKPVTEVMAILQAMREYACCIGSLNIQMQGIEPHPCAVVVPMHVFWRCSQYGQAHPLYLQYTDEEYTRMRSNKMRELVVTAPSLVDEERLAWYSVLEFSLHVLVSANAHGTKMGTTISNLALEYSLRTAEMAATALKQDRVWENVEEVRLECTLGEYRRETPVIYWEMAKASFSVAFFSLGITHRTVPLSAMATAHNLFSTANQMSRSPGGVGMFQWTPAGRFLDCFTHATSAAVCVKASEICFELCKNLRVVHNDVDGGFTMLKYACLCMAGALLCIGKMTACVSGTFHASVVEYTKMAPSTHTIECTWQKYLLFYDERFTPLPVDNNNAPYAIERESLTRGTLMHMAPVGVVVASAVVACHIERTLVPLGEYSGNTYTSDAQQ